MASSSSGDINIRYMAVARLTDRTIVAAHGPKMPMEEQTAEILGTERVGKDKEITITNPLGHFHIYCENNAFFLVVTSQSYPQMHAFRLLGELRDGITQLAGEKFWTTKEQGLSRTYKKLFQNLVEKYQKPQQLDKLASVSVQVESVKGMMQQNINTALANKDQVDNLLNHAQSMAQESSQFHRTAVATRNNMWWKNVKCLVGIIVACAVLVGVVAASFFFNQHNTPV